MIKALFSFHWRINRAKYFWYNLLLWLIVWILSPILSIVFLWEVESNSAQTITILLSCLILYPAVALIIKRFHDINKKWYWYVPVYSLSSIILPFIYVYIVIQVVFYAQIALWLVIMIVSLILLFKKWTVWPNQYWDDPIAEYNKSLADETVGGQKRRHPTRHRLLALNLLIVGFLWLIVSVVFWVIGSVEWTEVVTEPGLIDIIKSFVNRGLWFLSLLWIPATIIGIVLLNKKK